MVWTEQMNGKVVDEIWFNGANGDVRVKNTADKVDGLALIFEYSFHGDYDEGWVVQLSTDGREVRRYNARYIAEIKWIW